MIAVRGNDVRYKRPAFVGEISSKVPHYVRIDFSGMAEPRANPEATAMLAHALEQGFNIAIYTTLYGTDVEEAERITALVTKYAKQIEVLCLHLPKSKRKYARL